MDYVEADAGILRALAHPLRAALLYELYARGSANATVLARAVDAPVNSVSFHLRQLARFGLIEESEEGSGDGRQRWWRPAARSGMHIDAKRIEETPGGEAAMEVFHRNARSQWVTMIDRFFSAHDDPHEVWRSNDVPLLLTAAEADQLSTELYELLSRWMERSHHNAAEPAEEAKRRTYLAMTLLMPRHARD